MPGYYGVKLGRHWNGLKIEIWDLQDLHSNTVYLVLKGEIIFVLKIIKTYRASFEVGFVEKLNSPELEIHSRVLSSYLLCE